MFRAHEATTGETKIVTILNGATRTRSEPEINNTPDRAPKGSKKGLTRTSIQIDDELMERARNAVYWTPGASLNRLFIEGAEMLLDALEQKNGGSFPPRGRKKLLTGPRPK